MPNSVPELTPPPARSAQRSWPRHAWKSWASYVVPIALLTWAPNLRADEIVVAATGLVLALTHWILRPLTTTLVLLGAGHALALANAEKLRDTGDAILWQDVVHVLPNAASNFGTVLQYIGIEGLLATGTALLALPVVLWAERRHLVRSRSLGLAFSGLLLLLYLPTAIVYGEGVVADYRVYDRNAMSFAGRPNAAWPARFLHSLNLEPAEFQTGARSPALFREMAGRLPPIDNNQLVADRASPDIFVVLHESQFDPMQLSDCAGRQDCRMSMFEDGPHGLLRGPLRVHTLGWGTWNAEFTLMSGIPHDWFGGDGLYSAYTVAPRLTKSLGRHLASLGYRTIGIYPTQKGMLNAATAYRNYGIDEFYGAEELGLPLDWCRIPDSLMYEKLVERYRAARAESDRPVFMVMLTIFNHGPHGAKCDSSESRTSAQNVHKQKFEDYLNRSRQADAAGARFRESLLPSQRRVLMLFAGDHQPSFEGMARNLQRTMHRDMPADEATMFTNYQFFSNFDKPGRSSGHGPQELDISFLASTLLDFAALPLGPVFGANRQLRDLCGGRLDTCPGNGFLDSYRSHLMEIGFIR
jgi:hypothetical protein